ncbi:MAG: hypothetical protein ACREQV_21980, partial [Candidatus Binatia bacterium]
NTPTLVLVHRTPLLEQWRKQIAAFLRIDMKKIGVFDSTREVCEGQVLYFGIAVFLVAPVRREIDPRRSK